MTSQFEPLIGADLGVSRWFDTTQADVDAFAEVVGDRGWIHNDVKASAAGPYGGTLLQGFFMLGCLHRMARDMDLPTEGVLNRFNYGFDRVRFVSPVHTGTRIRGRFRITGVETRDGGDDLVRTNAVVEAEGYERPALVADWLFYVRYTS
ncbi:MAG: MaoC family dehydratase [Actinobacteria bacterium]|nr:MaoC family dehydratase [Actinomycetota bacterium]MDP7550597.1 MaoC family dehydratase [Acidimicrobiales bacterium]MBT3686743.1 MaoC family dehydratase [Actinomycetota bacterium]MBT4036546.1 MaoC family dehydratase [Actinomycetota bacterium]MBT4278131.1 MaoC family dehydratase [Actinomycetota bacterium]